MPVKYRQLRLNVSAVPAIPALSPPPTSCPEHHVALLVVPLYHRTVLSFLSGTPSSRPQPFRRALRHRLQPRPLCLRRGRPKVRVRLGEGRGKRAERAWQTLQLGRRPLAELDVRARLPPAPRGEARQGQTASPDRRRQERRVKRRQPPQRRASRRARRHHRDLRRPVRERLHQNRAPLSIACARVEGPRDAALLRRQLLLDNELPRHGDFTTLRLLRRHQIVPVGCEERDFVLRAAVRALRTQAGRDTGVGGQRVDPRHAVLEDHPLPGHLVTQLQNRRPGESPARRIARADPP